MDNYRRFSTNVSEYSIKSKREVIETYADLARQWINNIKVREPADQCYPINALPASELAELLEKKLSFMKSELLNNIDNIKLKA